MRRAGLLIALLALIAARAWTQGELAPSTGNGPLNANPSQPAPDKNGVYSFAPGILAPTVVQQVSAAIPNHASVDDIPGVCLLSLVVTTEGLPEDIRVVTTHGAAFDEAAIKAARQFKFKPGTIDGKPVPVRIYLRTRFFADERPPITRVLMNNDPHGGFSSNAGRIGDVSPYHWTQNYDRPPVPIYTPVPEYSEEARRKRIEGIVTTSVLINEEGLPTDARVEKPLGHGLDEKALECIRKYRFRPVTKDGLPVATRIFVEISFRLY